MRAIILALAMASIALPASAQTSCVELEEFVERMGERGGIVRPLSVDGQAAATHLYNATPPVSNETFGVVVVVELPDGAAQFWFGDRGAVCASLSIEAPGWRQMREAFIGRAT